MEIYNVFSTRAPGSWDDLSEVLEHMRCCGLQGVRWHGDLCLDSNNRRTRILKRWFPSHHSTPLSHGPGGVGMELAWRVPGLFRARGSWAVLCQIQKVQSDTEGVSMSLVAMVAMVALCVWVMLRFGVFIHLCSAYRYVFNLLSVMLLILCASLCWIHCVVDFDLLFQAKDMNCLSCDVAELRAINTVFLFQVAVLCMNV